MHYNILVFPCGSEIGLEIHRSLKYSRHITLYGGNSVDDHGRFVFDNYIPDIPFFDDANFVQHLKRIISEYNIDAIYPAMDSVISLLKEKEDELECRVIGSNKQTAELCLSKSNTYRTLMDHILTPKVFDSLKNIVEFPVFLKPDMGYGSRGTKKVYSIAEGIAHLNSFPDSLILEYLPGKEFTVDCFTDRHGKLLYYGARERKRVSNGISVNTVPLNERIDEIQNIVEIINDKIRFSGAWFVQIKEDSKGRFSLLEIAARLGGSSSLNRNLGVNFALLSVFNAFGIDVDVVANNYQIELDRALDNKYKLSIDYDMVYCDFDDCLILGDKINIQLLSFLYQCVNEEKKLVLITKHDKDIYHSLKENRLSYLFDEIIHIKTHERKFHYMSNVKSIFIDDSHLERREVLGQLGIPVFAPDNVECLMK